MIDYNNYDIFNHNQILRVFKVDSQSPSILRMLWRALKRLCAYATRRNSEGKCLNDSSRADVFFVANTSNDVRASKPVWCALSSHTYLALENELDFYSFYCVYYLSFRYLNTFFRSYVRASKADKLMMRTYFYDFFTTMGFLNLTDNIVERVKPKLIVMSNDHSPIQRAFQTVAKDKNIPDLYFQHCSVTEHFPPLQFTYSFLDGEESLEKYLSIGETKGTIYVSGNPRFDCISTYLCNRVESNKIGLAINSADDEEHVKELCLKLRENGIENILLRPHPRQILQEKDWYSAHHIEISDSKIEHPFEFLGRIKMLIASESGIHLDAVMMGVYSVCYSLTGDKAVDWYSYIKNGLIPIAETVDELMVLLKPENVTSEEKLREKAQWYNAAYGRRSNGHVGEMIADFIHYMLSDNIQAFDEKYDFVVKSQNENFTIKVYA